MLRLAIRSRTLPAAWRPSVSHLHSSSLVMMSTLDPSPSPGRKEPATKLEDIESSTSTNSTTAGASSPSKTHYPTDSDGEELVPLRFAEEPLGCPAADGYGWPQLDFGEVIGPGNRYTIVRKLGWGVSSSVWLAMDQTAGHFVAIKVLTGYYTGLSSADGPLWELDALKLLSGTSQSSKHCLNLLSHFMIPGKGSSGEHLCLVTQLLGGDVNSLRAVYKRRFPLPLAKRILLHTLRGVACAHQLGIVHTDLKSDNIFFDAVLPDSEIELHLKVFPSARHPPADSPDGMLQAAKSQPLPIPSFEDALKHTFVVADFGNAQPVNDHRTDKVTPELLRAPENYIRSPWDEKIDIWSFGCLIFEFVTSRSLFRYVPEPSKDLDKVENMLYQMLCYTEEDFPEHMLQYARDGEKYFDLTCNLLKHPRLVNIPFEHPIRATRAVEEADIPPMAALMKRCLRIDPADRASAVELLSDPWFEGVD